jgi:hypothetical protein
MSNNLNIMLISENYIKQRSTVMENVSSEFIRSNILIASDIHIQQILGSNLYDDIITQFENYKTAYDAGTTGITIATYVDSVYLTLIDEYIQPTLLYYTLYESMFDLYSKITNKSLVTQSSENSDVVSEEFLHKRKDDFLNKAEYYAQRLTNYLIDNQTIYPKYLEVDGDISDILPEDENYLSNGWYLKKTDGSCGGSGWSRFQEI